MHEPGSRSSGSYLIAGSVAGRRSHGWWKTTTWSVRRPATVAALAARSEPARRCWPCLDYPGPPTCIRVKSSGFPEVDVPPRARQDPAWPRCGVSRDGCRIPLPWRRRDNKGTHGFSPDAARSPWLPVPADWGRYSVQAQQADPASTLRLCQAALALRGRLHAQAYCPPTTPWTSTSTPVGD